MGAGGLLEKWLLVFQADEESLSGTENATLYKLPDRI
jgi:hypothetical protein